MFRLDEDILRTYFKLEEAQRQRLWMERVWHPELFSWNKQGAPPPITDTKRIRQGALAELGFGENHYQRMIEKEKDEHKELERLVELHCLWTHFANKRIKGFSHYLIGAFIAAGGDIQRTPTASAFWKGMGLDIVNGVAPRRIRGRKQVDRKVPCLPHVSRVGEQIRQQLLRSGGLGKQLYDENKADYLVRYPDKPKLFAHKHGLRIAQKILYACLWEQWRLGYGLDAPWPYAFAILGHDGNHRYTISDFYS